MKPLLPLVRVLRSEWAQGSGSRQRPPFLAGRAAAGAGGAQVLVLLCWGTAAAEPRLWQRGFHGRGEGGNAIPRNLRALNPQRSPFIEHFVFSGVVLKRGKRPELKDAKHCQKFPFLPWIP